MAPHLPQLYPQSAPAEFEIEAHEPPVRADPPQGLRRHLVGGPQLPADPLLDRLFDMHGQGDDAHSIVHTGNSSTVDRNCNRIRHRSDSYCRYLSDLELWKNPKKKKRKENWKMKKKTRRIERTE